MDDDELGAALHALEPMLLRPQAPDVSAAVADAIRSGRRPRRRLSRRARVVILIAAALLMLATAAAATRLVIDLGGIRIEPQPTASSPTGAPLNGAAFGQPIDLARAADAAGFRPTIPRALGAPDRVWLTTGPLEDPGSVLIAMAWFPRPGLPRIPGTPFGASLIEIRGTADILAKHVGTPFVELPASGAYWIRAPHELELLTGDGTRLFVVTGHVLVWQRGDVALRFETNLSRERMLALAGLPD